MTEPGRYRFAPLERRGLIAGVRGGQVATVAGGLVLGLIVLRAASDPVLGAALAFSCAALAAAAAWVPARGRTAEEWAPVVLWWVRDRLLRRHRHVDSTCLTGTPAATPAGGSPALPVGRGTRAFSRVSPLSRISRVSRLGGPLAGCEFVVPPVGLGGRRLAVVRDRRSGTCVGVLAVRASGFALVGGDEQRRRVDGWASVLSGLAREGTSVHRAQWVLRVVPGDADDLLHHLGSAGSGDAPVAAVTSYRDLVENAGPATQRHEAFLVLAVNERRAAGRLPGGAPAVVARELGALETALASTDVHSDGPLGLRALNRLLREMADADAPRQRAAEEGPAAHRGSEGADVAVGQPGPGSSDERLPLAGVPTGGDAAWSRYRADGGYHVTYWIAEWPRVDVGPEFLTPLLLGAQHRRTVAMVLEPVPARRAAREAEAARTAHMADDELRRRGGFITSARRRREQQEVLSRESELAQGHVLYRYSGYATVSARSPEELTTACSELEVAAARAHLDLRRLYGQQAEAFSWTLPLARGLA